MTEDVKVTRGCQIERNDLGEPKVQRETGLGTSSVVVNFCDFHHFFSAIFYHLA